MLHNKLMDAIEFEISEIDHVLVSFKQLIDLCRSREPDLIEKTAIASVLHSFYNGIESILIGIAKNIDRNIPNEKN